MVLEKKIFKGFCDLSHGSHLGHVTLTILVRHRNLEYQPKRAIPSIENVFAFFERGYTVHYKTK